MKNIFVLALVISFFSCASSNVVKDACTGNCSNGNGKYVWQNGSTYEGQWKNGKREGLGKYHYSNGSVYEGQWLNDKKNGTGTLWIYENKKLIGKYVGTWLDDEMHGIITIYDENNLFIQKMQYFKGKNIGSLEK